MWDHGLVNGNFSVQSVKPLSISQNYIEKFSYSIDFVKPRAPSWYCTAVISKMKISPDLNKPDL